MISFNISLQKMNFDSIYAGSDWRAYGALTALLEAGIKVPEDMKVLKD